MVIQPRDEIYEPVSVFRSTPFCPRFTPQNRVAGRAAGLLVLARVPRARRSGCSEVLPLHMPSHQRGCPASTVARRHCAPRVSAGKRPKPRRAAILAAMRMGRLGNSLRRDPPERGRRPAIAICPTQPFPTGLQAPGARRWPRLPVPPSLAERMPSLAGTASKEAIHSESQAPGCSAQLR